MDGAMLGQLEFVSNTTNPADDLIWSVISL